MELDGKAVGLILIVVGIGFLVGGVLISMSSTAIAADPSSAAYNVFESYSVRLGIGVCIAALGLVLIILGAYTLMHY